MADKRPERSNTSIKAILAATKKAEPICQLRFPYQLYDMLRDATKNGFDDVVSWLPCGTAFKVFDQHLFEELIMPVYFKMSNFKSFLRQLNFYQFQRLQPGTRGNLLLVFHHCWKLTISSLLPSYKTIGSYSHDHLVRHRRHDCQLIQRRKKNRNGDPPDVATKNDQLPTGIRGGKQSPTSSVSPSSSVSPCDNDSVRPQVDIPHAKML
jgi:hypothetical protein